MPQRFKNLEIVCLKESYVNGKIVKIVFQIFFVQICSKLTMKTPERR